LNGSIGLNYRNVSAEHEFRSKLKSNHQSFESFLDFEHQIIRRLYISGGIRGFYIMHKLESDTLANGKLPSLTGNWSSNWPFCITSPDSGIVASKNTLTYAWHAGMRYKYSPEFNVFAGASEGIRPRSFYLNNQIPAFSEPEKLRTYYSGFKLVLSSRIYFDANGFYQIWKGFQSHQTNNSNPLSILMFDGKSTSFGIETKLDAALLKGLRVFGHYAWTKSFMNKNTTIGVPQLFGGLPMLFSPLHRLNAGVEASVSVKKIMRFHISPVYSWQSKQILAWENPDGKIEPAYGILNVSGGAELLKEKISLGIYTINLLETQYSRDFFTAGNPVNISYPIPGVPRMFGTRLTWRF
jgi:outer membrane receptor protein involved in Fe transport